MKGETKIVIILSAYSYIYIYLWFEESLETLVSMDAI